MQGAGRLLLTSFSTAVGGIIQLLKVGVQGVFQSAVALLGQPTLWQGIASNRAALFDLFADLISKLPTTMRFGADVEGLREAAEAGSVIAETWSTILGDAASIPEFQKLRDNFAILSDSTKQLASAPAAIKSALSSSAVASQAASNALPSGSAYDMSDTLAKVGRFLGGRGSAMESEQRRTNSLMQMSIDLLKGGIDIWRNMQTNGGAATWA